MDTPSYCQFGAALAIGVLGIGLIFNPFYFYPGGGGEPKVTHSISEIENETVAQQALGLSERVLDCPGDRLCALESRILEDGAIESPVSVRDDGPRWYSVVQTANGTYLPEQNVRNGTTILTLTEASAMEAIAQLAIPADERPTAVREAIETGSITVYGERIAAFERYEVIEQDGHYYQRMGYEGIGDHWTADGGLAIVRALLFLLGIGLVARSGWRFRSLY
ncbi:hypothetical protein [Halomicrobium katesii]|uniref:hypothetical protein n=1 Tax=Halomicrobium katesii TaxID=437163 RepID=UPI0005D145C1|nr:hypothetical protein [Halomicrobium katesii]